VILEEQQNLSFLKRYVMQCQESKKVWPNWLIVQKQLSYKYVSSVSWQSKQTDADQLTGPQK